jgi:EAL domain-containing protein (putative c-di-GMP-specific phosphodiesterase class I)
VTAVEFSDGVTRTPLDLSETLQLVTDTIVECLGFEVAVINLVDDDETAQQAADLQALGVGHAQGYFFGRPGPLT